MSDTVAGRGRELGFPAGQRHRHHTPGPPPEDPQQFAQWWQDLDREHKDAVYDRDHFIGNHPGMPFDDKTLYNERHLPELMANAQADIDRLQASRDQVALTPGGNLATFSQLSVLDSQLDEAKRNLDGYRAVQQAMHPRGSLSDLMKASPDGTRNYLGFIDNEGRAAVSIGNPDKATRNAVLVPGTGADLTKMSDAIEKSLAMYNAAHDADTDLHAGDVAVTTWMAYDRPMGLAEAAHTDYARNGAAGLDSFEAGMRASHIGAPSTDTVIGHSYGSTLVGAAATGGHHLAADNVIAVGSPGMLAGYAGGLNLNPGAEVFASRASNDIINAATGLTLGPDPAGLAFSAVRLDADPGPPGILGIPGTSIGAHSSYWSQGNRALLNFGAVIAGVQAPFVVGPLGSVVDIPPHPGGPR